MQGQRAAAADVKRIEKSVSKARSRTSLKAFAKLTEVVRETPVEYLVLETDSPYGAPQRFRGKRNEPAYAAEAALRVAELKDMTVEAVAETTTRNAFHLFGITDPVTSSGAGR